MRRFLERTGGHVTVRDFFLHSLEHPGLDPYVYFTPDSVDGNDLWAGVPDSRIVRELRPERYDVLFLGSFDREFLGDADLVHPCVLNAILHVRHARHLRLRRYLRRPALRICNSEAVREAVAPMANGVVGVVPNGVDTELFHPAEGRAEAGVLILGLKRPRFARRLARMLAREGVAVQVQAESIPRREFAERLRRCRVFVPLPNPTEGFYRPALEGMASGCAVVCPDVVGNRDYSQPDRNCLQPRFEKLSEYLAAVRLLLDRPDLADQLRGAGRETADRFTLENHRQRYYDFLAEHVLAPESHSQSRANRR